MIPFRVALGLSFGAVLAGLGFGPSLLPRTWETQAVLSGVLFGIGYLPGYALGGLGLLKSKRWSAWVLVGPVALLLMASYLGAKWNEQSRQLIDIGPGPSGWGAKSVFGSLLLGLALVGLFHLSIWVLGAVFKRLEHRLGHPRLVAALLCVVVLTGFSVSRRAVIRHLANSINELHAGKNQETEEGVSQPSLPTLGGSPPSLVSWESLGEKGRTFVATAPSKREISEFFGAPAKDPIRAYAGVLTAEDLPERVDLAVKDLKRAGGFQRKVLVVITTTGTGWVDELGVLPLEYMHGGDTASVAVQYSYLPSVFSFIADRTRARRAGQLLFERVYHEWEDLPEEERPLLLSFGESLGSYGTEAAFPEVKLFLKRSDGALLVGPPNANPIWQEAMSRREPGTPVVLPIVGDGAVVRFARRPDDLEKPTTEWGHPRAVYLQNSSDPIVWWSPSVWWKKPLWLREPPGPDVNPAMTWIPLVTFLQVSADYLEARAPDGHGHRYGTLPVYAWGKIAPPEGWTEERARSLAALIEKRYR